MARFLNGLNMDIADRVELQHYMEMEDMVHMTMKIERKLQRKGKGKQANTFSAQTNSGRPNWRNDNKAAQIKKDDKAQLSQSLDNKNKGTTSTQNSRSRDIKCFRCLGYGHIASQCPNKRAMVMRGNGVETDEESNDEDEMPPLEDCSDVELPTEGQLLVTRRALNVQVKEDNEGVRLQRENLFYTRCLVEGKVCSLIIDGGSCVNVASTLFVDKLGLETTKHPRPYRLQWLNNSGEVKVTKQVRVPFTIGRYHDEVNCDVVPMQASHLLLGRPWQWDRRVNHDGYLNRYMVEK